MDIQIDHKVPATMRDGTVLYSDVYRPKAPGRYPVIVERVAYDLESRLKPYAEFFASHGYVFVGQNTRGTYWSEGEFRGIADDGWGERKDGYDTIEWAACQPWSDGNIGTMDGSWSGITQCLLAPTRPPHLRTMFLRQAPAGDIESTGGISGLGLRMGLLNHALERAKHPSASARLKSFLGVIEEACANPMPVLSSLPASDWPVLMDVYPEFELNIKEKPNSEERKEADITRKGHEIDVPIFHLGGWFDIATGSTLGMYTAVRDNGFSERARNNQRLLIGPWVHGPFEPDNSVQGDIDFGPEAALGINEFRLKWFDYWLKGIANDVPDMPRVRLFVMGENCWRDFNDWPPAGATETKLYLQDGEGLGFEAPAEDSASTSYDYDPFDPVSEYSGGKPGFQGMGPIDMSPSEDRKIVFTSEPLQQPITVIGTITANLWAKSSARDTDWFVTVTDVHPDGRSMRVSHGQLRARYREGFDREVLMEPGKPYLFEFGIGATAQRFDAGHRVRIAITSSQFPSQERNMNSGGDTALETTGLIAHNTILHERDHPSCIILPVMK